MNTKVTLLFGAAAMTSIAMAVNFPNTGTDIASNGADGWNGTMPDANTKAQIATANQKLYASDDINFGEFAFAANATLTMNKDGIDRTATISKLWLTYYNRSVTIHGGLWDIQGLGLVASCNESGTYNTSLTLDQGCIVTNATTLWVGYKTDKNTFKITD